MTSQKTIPTTVDPAPVGASAGPDTPVGQRQPAADRPHPTTIPARRRLGGLFRHRDYRLFWTGNTVSRLGSSVTSVAVPLVAVVGLDTGTFGTAVLVGAAWLPWLVIGLPVGAWVDRLPARPLMIVCDLVSFVLFLSVPVAAALGALTYPHLLGVTLGAGTASVFFQTAHQVCLPGLLKPAEVPEGNAKLQGSESVVQVAGPGLAGLLVQVAGAANALLLDATSFLVSAYCLLRIRATEPPRRRATTTRLRTEIIEGLRFLTGDPYLRVLAVFGAVSNLGLVGYQAVLVVFLVREVGVSPGLVGALLAATSLGGVLGATVVSRLTRRLGSARTLLLGELVAAPAGLLIPLTRPGWGLSLLVVGGFVLVAGVVTGNVVKGSFRQTYVPRRLLGRVTASMQLINFGTIPLGALLAGALGVAVGVRATLWAMMVTLVLAGLILLVGPIRHRRDLPEGPAG